MSSTQVETIDWIYGASREDRLDFVKSVVDCLQEDELKMVRNMMCRSRRKRNSAAASQQSTSKKPYMEPKAQIMAGMLTLKINQPNQKPKMSSEQSERFVLGILLFDDVELLDFCGPFEVFSIAGELLQSSFKVFTLAQKATITARNGLKVVPTYVIGGSADIPKLDILLVPGGKGTIVEVNNESLLNWIKLVEPSAEYILSVCTGVALLGKCGFIDNMTVTTHRKCFDRVQPDCPKTNLCRCQRFTDNGKFLTSAGISAGIDLSFYFVKKMFGADSAKLVAEHMEYDWRDLDISKCICKFN